MIQIGGVCMTFYQEVAYFCRSIAIEMGGVSRYFSKVSGSGVDSIHLKNGPPKSSKSHCGNFRSSAPQP